LHAHGRARGRNEKHKYQWAATLNAYAYPLIGALPVQAIDTALVLKVLEPIWTTKPETASRVRGRLENVLDWAKVRGFREGENQARWRGHLDKLLPASGKVRKVQHHAALPYAEPPAFIAALQAQEGVSARALEFAILTAARTGEVIGARLNEVSEPEKVWTVPLERMKAGKEHAFRCPRERSPSSTVLISRPLASKGRTRRARSCFLAASLASRYRIWPS
jgi:integrase